MTDIIHALSSSGGIIVMGIIGLWIICATAESICKSSSRERTKREIAAYIAEGSITPEEGAQLIAAKPGKNGCRGSASENA